MIEGPDGTCLGCESVRIVTTSVGRCSVDGGKLLELPIVYLSDTGCENYYPDNKTTSKRRIQAPQKEG